MFACAQNTTSLAQFKLTPDQNVFHKHPLTPLTFSLNSLGTSSEDCPTLVCGLSTHYSDNDRNPFV